MSDMDSRDIAIMRDVYGLNERGGREHAGGTGPSWRDAYEPPTCPECGSVLTRGHDHLDHYYCMDCDVEYAAEEVE